MNPACEALRLCIHCQHHRQKPFHPIMVKLGFQSKQLCAAPDAMRHDALSLVSGNPTSECQEMRSSPHACGVPARWFMHRDLQTSAHERPLRLMLASPTLSTDAGASGEALQSAEQHE
jgi:hypothetical protein